MRKGALHALHAGNALYAGPQLCTRSKQPLSYFFCDSRGYIFLLGRGGGTLQLCTSCKAPFATSATLHLEQRPAIEYFSNVRREVERAGQVGASPRTPLFFPPQRALARALRACP